jgi:hypothetical protein
VAETPEEAVDLLGQLTVQLDAEYTLRPSRQAISNIVNGIRRMRGLSGQFSLTQLAVECGSLCLSVDELGLCVAELMNAVAAFDPKAGMAYKAAKPEKCADLIYDKGPVDVSRRLSILFTGALTGGYTSAGEPKAIRTTEPTPIAD